MLLLEFWQIELSELAWFIQIPAYQFKLDFSLIELLSFSYEGFLYVGG